MRKQILGILLLALAVCLMSVNVYAQFTDANLVGIVTDSTGAAVPGATVTLTNKDTGVKSATSTGASGDYRFNNVPVGSNYEVSVSAKGFATATVAGVTLELNHTATINLTVAVGTVSTTVEVTEATAPIDTTSSQLQTTFNTSQAVDLGLAGFATVSVADASSIYNLSLLGAGVASAGGVGQGTGPSIAGQRPENNFFMVDGVPNNSGYSTGPEEYISNEVLAEMNVAQNQFSAEFGGASGGVFNAVIKSGTNAIHGSIYEYFQNRDLNAVDYNTVVAGNRSNPRYDNNRLGATIGGPIIRNKLFYFGSYEYNPIGQASVPGNPVDAPTAAGISLLNGMSSLNKNNLQAFEKYVPVPTSVDASNPSTTVNGVTIPLGALTFASPNFSNAYHAVVAIDYNISEKDQLRGRWLYDNFAGIDNAANLPIFFGTLPNYNNAGSISEFHSFSPTLLNEFRVAYRRFNGNASVPNITFPGLDVFPNLTFDDLNLQLGPDPNAPGGSISNTASLQENLTKTWGKHTFKMGYMIIDSIIDGTFVQRVRGDYDFANLEQYLLDQQPSGGALSGVAGERSGGFAGVPFGFLQHAAYFQDDWRISRKLTLNLGVRYEYVTVPVGSRAQALSAIASVPGVINFAAPKSSPNDWSPRIGFAYTPDSNGKWVVRGGVARSYDNTYINLNQNASPPYYQTTLDVDPSNPVSGFLAHGGLSGAPPPPPTNAADARGAVASYTFDQTRPYALTGTIGVQHLIGNDYTVEARYTYTKGVHLWNQTRVNILSPLDQANYGLPTFFTMPSASVLSGLTQTLGYLQQFPRNSLAQYGFPNNITGYHPWGNSRYNGLALQMTKRYSKNLMYLVAYTWSQNFDDSTATNFSTILSPRRAQDFQNMRAEWADSALDRRQRLTITPMYDFRPFQGGSWLMKNLVGNWSVSGTYTFQSPEFATIQSGVDSNLNGDNAPDRTVINTAGTWNAGTGVIGLTSTGQQVKAGSSCSSGPCKNIVAYVAQSANARYVVAGLGAKSDAGRNTFPLGRINDFDASLIKRLSLTERFKMDFGIQTFNLLNHSQFTGGRISDVNFYNTASISRSFLIPNNPEFGQYNLFLPSNSRQVQLVAHFIF